METLRSPGMTGNRLYAARGVYVSSHTICRWLAELNLRPYVPATGRLLNAAQGVAPLRFAQKHSDWTEAEWASVPSSDECRITIYASGKKEENARLSAILWIQYNSTQDWWLCVRDLFRTEDRPPYVPETIPQCTNLHKGHPGRVCRPFSPFYKLSLSFSFYAWKWSPPPPILSGTTLVTHPTLGVASSQTIFQFYKASLGLS